MQPYRLSVCHLTGAAAGAAPQGGPAECDSRRQCARAPLHGACLPGLGIDEAAECAPPGAALAAGWCRVWDESFAAPGAAARGGHGGGELLLLAAMGVCELEEEGARRSHSGHYSASAAGYERAFFYADGSEYQTWQLGVVARACGLVAADVAPRSQRTLRVVDVGGGTGNFTRALCKYAGIIAQPTVVDCSADMLALVGGFAHAVEADAVTYSREIAAAGEADKADIILLKEIMHHLDGVAADEALRNLVSGLRIGGRLVVVTRPHEPTVALFEAAKRVWRRQQPDAHAWAQSLRGAHGTPRVDEFEAAYAVTMPAAEWGELLRSRFWSTLSREHFDDVALEAGVAEAVEGAGGEASGVVRFDDTLVLLVAHAEEAASPAPPPLERARPASSPAHAKRTCTIPMEPSDGT